MPEACSRVANSVHAGPSKRQTVMALILMVCLAAIAAGLYAAQFRFNPAVSNFLTGPAASMKSAAAKPGDAEPIFTLPDGMAPLSPVEHFDRETLSEKINGKAELYLSAGFLRLDCQRIRLKGGADAWMEVFVYDMGSVQNAYAVFSQQRRTDSLPLDLAEFAYRAENALFMVHGPYYLEIIASEKDEELAKSMTSMARAFMDSRPVSTAGAIAERDLFPESGLDERSISLIPADAFGFPGLDRVFTAIYRQGGSEATAFLSKRATPREAENLAASYLEFLKTYGGQLEASDQRIPGAVIITILDAYEVVFAQGRYLAGVHESSDKEMAVSLARELFDKLKEDTGVR